MGKHDALFVLAITLVGCSRTKPPPKPGNPDSADNQALLLKLQAYLHCIEDHSEPVFKLADLYAARLGRGLPAAERIVALPAASDPKKCLDAIREARTLPPSRPELERAADAFAMALTTTHTLTSAARVPANGLALYPKLTAAFAQFVQTQGALYDQVARLNQQVRIDQLSRREKVEGRTIGILVDLAMVRAEELVRIGATTSDQLEVIDLAAFEARLAAFAEILDEMNAHALSEPKQTEIEMPGFSILADASLAYRMSAQQLLHRARAKIPYSETEKIQIEAGNEAAVAATPAALIKAYNQLVAFYYYR